MPNTKNKKNMPAGKRPRRNKSKIGGEYSQVGRFFNKARRSHTQVSRPIGAFDDTYRCVLKCEVQNTILTASALSSNSSVFKGNCMYNIGPRTNYAGGYSSNYCTGVKYLLGTAITNPATAPYSSFRVFGSKIEVDIVNLPVAATTGLTFAVLPMIYQDATNLSRSSITEQEGCVWKYIAGSASTKPTRISNSMSTASMYGLLNEGQVRADSNNSGAYGNNAGAVTVDPVNIWYWNVVVISNDGTTALNCQYSAFLYFDVEFYGLNTLSTAAPTFDVSTSPSACLSTSSSSSSSSSDDFGEEEVVYIKRASQSLKK